MLESLYPVYFGLTDLETWFDKGSSRNTLAWIMFAVIFDDGYTNRNIFYFYRRVGYSPNQVKNTTKFYFNIIMWLKLVTSDSRFVSVGN